MSSGPSDPARADPSELARRVAGELDRLRDDAVRLEAGIRDAIPATALHDPALLASLQSIDRMRQAVEGLAAFQVALSGVLSSDLTIEVDPLVRGLALRDVAARLRGQRPCDERPTGDLDLF